MVDSMGKKQGDKKRQSSNLCQLQPWQACSLVIKDRTRLPQSRSRAASDPSVVVAPYSHAIRMETVAIHKTFSNVALRYLGFTDPRGKYATRNVSWSVALFHAARLIRQRARSDRHLILECRAATCDPCAPHRLPSPVHRMDVEMDV